MVARGCIFLLLLCTVFLEKTYANAVSTNVSSFLSCRHLLGSLPLATNISEHAVLTPIADYTSLFSIDPESGRIAPLDARHLSAQTTPLLRRSIALREYVFPNFKIKVLSPVTLSGLSKHFNDVFNVNSSGGTLTHEGLSPVDVLLRSQSVTTDQLNRAQEVSVQLMLEDSRRYLREELKVVAETSRDMRDRRGWNTQRLEDLVEKYLQNAVNIEIQNLNGETLGSFRIIMAPYGYKKIIGRRAFDEPNQTIYGSFGPSVVAQFLSAEDRELYNIWLATKNKTSATALSTHLYGDDYLAARKENAFAFFEMLEARNQEKPLTGLMMEDIIPKSDLLRLFPDTGLLPRDGDPYRFEAAESTSYHSGIIQEWGKFRIKKGTSPEAFMEGLTCALSVLFDERFTPFYALSAQKIFTYGNEVTLEVDSAFGFHKATELSFQNPFNDSSDPWWVLMATPQQVLEAVYLYKQEKGIEAKRKLEAILRLFMTNNSFGFNP